jgi:hypothetical protein
VFITAGPSTKLFAVYEAAPEADAAASVQMTEAVLTQRQKRRAWLLMMIDQRINSESNICTHGDIA